MLVEENGMLKPYEIKSGFTMERKYLNGLRKFSEISNGAMSQASVIYSGERTYIGQDGNFVRYDQVSW